MIFNVYKSKSIGYTIEPLYEGKGRVHESVSSAPKKKKKYIYIYIYTHTHTHTHTHIHRGGRGNEDLENSQLSPYKGSKVFGLWMG